MSLAQDFTEIGVAGVAVGIVGDAGVRGKAQQAGSLSTWYVFSKVFLGSLACCCELLTSYTVLLRPIVQSYVIEGRELNKFGNCHMSFGPMNITKNTPK